MRKNNDVFIDYKLLKTCVSIIMVLDHYGWVRELKGTGNTVRSTCPIHNGSNDKQFVVNIRKNTWCCFGDCRKGGSILELVASYEKIDIREAAVRIASWFPLSLPHSPTRSTVMSDNKKPTHKVFVVEEREGEGKDEDAFWTRVGSAWPHKDGKGYNIVLSALPLNGRLVLREFTEDDDKADDGKSRYGASTSRNDNGRNRPNFTAVSPRLLSYRIRIFQLSPRKNRNICNNHRSLTATDYPRPSPVNQ